MSRQRLDEHRAVWQEKPVLAGVYAAWFDALLEQAPPRQRVLEVGAGPGLLSAYARWRRPDLQWVASDILAAPWNDVVADAARLPFPPASFDRIVCLDLVHHLGRPRDFFVEAARVLRSGGRIASVEPWVSPLSYPIYRWLHEEGCDLGIDPWSPFGSGPKEAFQGNGALAWRIVRSADAGIWRSLGLSMPRVTKINAFAYLLSLGFRRRSLLPMTLLPLARRFDDATRFLAALTAMRAVITWDRGASPRS